jgi:ribosomal-protein-alanine N-acetyltransferase
VIETPRLTLREPTTGDLDDLAAMYADPEVMGFIGTGGVLGRDDAARYIERQLGEYRERGFGEWATSRARPVRRSASAG